MEIRSRASRLTFGRGDNQLLVTRGGGAPWRHSLPMSLRPYTRLPPQEAREKLKSLTLTHFADDKLNHRGSGPGLEPERMIRPVLPAHGPGTAGPSVGPSPGRSPSRSRAPETQRTACPRLSPPLGSTERHVPGTHGDAPTSQDWGVWGWGSSGRGREADGEEKAPPAPQRRSSLGPRSRQPRRGAPITGFHLHTPGRPRLPGNAHPSPVLP